MIKRPTPDWGRLLLCAATASLILSIADVQAATQNPQRRFEPGEMVEVGGGQSVQIISCEGAGEWDNCEVQYYVDGKPTGPRLRETNRNIRAGEERVKAARRRDTESNSETSNNGGTLHTPATAPPPPTNAPPARQTKRGTTPGGSPPAGLDGHWKIGDKLEVNDRAFWYPAQIIAIQGGRYKVHYEDYPSSNDTWVDESRMRPVGGFVVTAECSFEPPGPAVSKQSRFSEALAKRKIYDEYNWRANGTLSAPLKIGVVFLSFQLKAPYKNTVANVPGYGAQRRHGGAPPEASIYPFKSRRMICEQYRDGVTRRLVDGTSACFIDKDNSWTCPSENDTKITQLD